MTIFRLGQRVRAVDDPATVGTIVSPPGSLLDPDFRDSYGLRLDGTPDTPLAPEYAYRPNEITTTEETS